MLGRAQATHYVLLVSLVPSTIMAPVPLVQLVSSLKQRKLTAARLVSLASIMPIQVPHLVPSVKTALLARTLLLLVSRKKSHAPSAQKVSFPPPQPPTQWQSVNLALLVLTTTPWEPMTRTNVLSVQLASTHLLVPTPPLTAKLVDSVNSQKVVARLDARSVPRAPTPHKQGRKNARNVQQVLSVPALEALVSTLAPHAVLVRSQLQKLLLNPTPVFHVQRASTTPRQEQPSAPIARPVHTA